MATFYDGFPLILGWELTLACNLRCLHCASAAGDARPNELSLEEALLISDEFPALLVQEVVFTGGEPLLSPLWEPLARHLQKSGIRAGMVTNASGLNDATVARLKNAGVTGIAVSLDGLESTHDHLRGLPGLFGRVQAGVRRALKAGFEVTIITTVSPLNIDQLPEMLRILRDIGVKRWQLQPIFAFGRTRDRGELRLSGADYLRLIDFIRGYYSSAQESGIELFPADGVGYFCEIDSKRHPWCGCSAGIASCGIMSDGRVKGCLSWPDSMVEGNLREKSLWDIWFGDNAFACTRQLRREDLGGACRDCPVGLECGGGCTAISLASTGRLHADPYCFRTLTAANGELKLTAVPK